MSLLFSTNTDDIDIAGSTSLSGTVFSGWMWFYPTSFTNNTFIMFQQSNAAFGGHVRWQIRGTTGSMKVRTDQTGTDAEADVVDSVLSTNTWHFIAHTYDASDSTRLRVFVGSLTSPVAETSYNASSNGTGSADGSGTGDNLFIGNNSASSTSAFAGRVATVGFHVGTRLSVAQLRTIQFNPKTALNYDPEVFMHCGFSGTTTQIDLSGKGNDGTIGGTSLAPHVPLGPPFGAGEELAFKHKGRVV